jgi:DNA-binding CsgD family transcriptional regulator
MGTGLIMPAWRMTGRAAELAQLDAAIGAGGGGIVLAGTAGAGKTRLLREALHRASRAGRDVAQVAATRCTAAIPFGAVAGLLPPGGPAAGPPWELLRRATDHLTRPAAQAPLVVGADDVHLLDPESAALLHHLVLHGAVFLLAAVRAGEPAPDAVAALWKDGLAGRLTVHPLPAAAMDDLLVQALGTAVQDGARQHIQWVTSGSPLLLRELLAGALDAGALVRQETGWGWEHEIALLATSGLTSKAIAASLHLSVRTVNNHLARTYAKAGISCRAELAAIMTRTTLSEGAA